MTERPLRLLSRLLAFDPSGTPKTKDELWAEAVEKANELGLKGHKVFGHYLRWFRGDRGDEIHLYEEE